ncbi:Uncharacterized Fe-S center protein-like protein [Desulforamulus reducens MI-1]|uniref:Uncharacterized Fe-S center protein-like protein n=1 Tax=Desulforamulus reducens (strain ATCC BAA-1160 / DSM 100696 / MI-1) TaxID=349161 RepID=A4J408_DESRM|nr:hypothetical protein [Desulforamulus reducens]ABO49811.1 Uncharacterized Fe-S center protein-like protein [Desulforamulus reducens MI-1]
MFTDGKGLFLRSQNWFRCLGIGILASLDPVALDQACIDLINQEHGLPGLRLEGQPHGSDKFRALWPHVDWKRGLEYAESIGLGTRKYELIKI